MARAPLLAPQLAPQLDPLLQGPAPAIAAPAPGQAGLVVAVQSAGAAPELPFALPLPAALGPAAQPQLAAPRRSGTDVRLSEPTSATTELLPVGAVAVGVLGVALLRRRRATSAPRA